MKIYLQFITGIIFPFLVPLITKNKTESEKEIFYDGIVLGIALWLTVIILFIQWVAILLFK